MLVALEAILEVESLIFILHDFDLGPFLRAFLPLFAHCMALALLAVGFLGRWRYSRAEDRAWIATALSLCLPLPFLGFLAFVSLYALYAARPKGSGQLLKDLEAYITYDPSQADLLPTAEDVERFITEEVDVAPLADILKGDDIALKRGAILSLSRLPKREAVSLLKSALSDPSREIRYYAGNALSEMEREFNDHIYRLLREIERSPMRLERYTRLANLILEYATSGLLEPVMVRYFAEIGIKALDKASIVGRPEPRLKVLLGRLYALAGRLAEAEKVLQDYLSEYPNDVGATLLLAEIAFQRGETELARRVVAEGLARFPQEPRLSEVAALLGGEAE